MGKKPWEQFNGSKDIEVPVDETPMPTDDKKPWEQFSTVKKKENTLSVPASPKSSTPAGSEESGAVSEHPIKPTGSLIEAQDIQDLKSLEHEYGSNILAKTFATVLLTAGKQLYSGFTEQIPKNIAQAKEVSKSALQSANIEEFIKNKKPTSFQRYVREKEPYLKWYQPFDMDKYIDKHKEAFINEKFPEVRKKIEKNAPEIIAGRLETEKFVQQKNKETGETLAGIPQSYKQITSPKEAVEYATNLGAQGLWQIPLTILTKGLSGEMMEAASVYDNQLDALADKHGISREEVIKQNLDKPAKGQLYAIAAAGLDRLSAGNLVSMVRKGGAPMLKQALAATGETITEPIQGTLEEMGGAKGAEKSQVEAFQNAWTTNFSKRVDEAFGGLFGSTAINILTPHQTISNAKDQIKSTNDVKSIEEHAAKIIESVKNSPEEHKQAPEEGVKDASKIESPVTLGEQSIGAQSLGGKGSEGMGSSQQGQESSGASETPIGQNESNALSEQQKEETLTPTQNENDTQLQKGEEGKQIPRETGIEEIRKEGEEVRNEINPTENESQQVPSGIQQEEIGSEPTYAKDVIGRIHEAVQSQPGEKASDSKIRTQEETALEEEAKKQGHWIEAPTSEPNAEGQEQTVYLDEAGSKVTKINKGVMHSTWKDFMDRIDRHNELFPDVAYKVKGFTRVNGEFGVVLEQPMIKGVAATEEEIKSDLEKMGFKQWGPEPLKRTTFHSKEAGVTLKDVHNDNVIKDEEGNLRYIDTLNEPYDEQIYGEEQPVQATETPVIPPGKENAGGNVNESPQGKQFAVAKRIMASDANPAIKQGIKEQGDTYVPKGLNVTEQEAQDLIDHHGPDKVELMIKDPNNGLTGDTRVVLSGKLYETYAATGQNVKAVDMAIWAENFLMQAGRTANAGKFWKMITSSGEDQIVLAIERQQQRNQEYALTDIDRSKTKAQLEAEFRRLVEEKVQSTVESRLEAAKLITKEKRKEIGDFFDSLKIDTKNNIASAALLPIGVLPHVWNAAVDVIKQAVLTGADVANAIQAGIDHIKANQKEPFDEQKFRYEFTPEVQKIMPKKKIKAEDIDLSKIKTPKILGKKKIDFINKVVDAFNKGELTDKKFDEIYASKLGFREFTSEDRAKIRKLAKTIAESEKFDDQLRALPADQFTRENIAKMKGLREAAMRANKDLQEYSQAPADVWDTLIAVMQANLMSTMSLVSNVWYNVTYSPLRSASLGIASILDYGMSKMAKVGMMPKAMADRSIDFAAIQKGYVQGMWNGTLEGLKQLKTGTQADEANLREIHSKFNPGKAVDRWANEDRTLKQKANDYIEGTIGWEAETVFRLLNLGDKPFKRAAELARVMEIGAKKGLKGKELEKFILLPDAESEAQIVQSGKEATFQQDTSGGKIVQNALTQFLNFVSSVPVIGGPAKVIIKSQIPFVKTPLNLIIETIQYAAPPATFATGVYQIANGNKRSGSVLVGKSIVGAMLWKAATSLFLKGLLTGDDDKDKKKRDFQLDKTPPPNSINTSALSRGLAFGDWSIHDGDTWVSYAKMGVAGICLDNYSNIYKERIANHGDITGGPEMYMLDMMQSAPRVASSTIEQSFLQGTSSALEALKSGDEKTMNAWLVKTTESVGSILYPNTIATVAKASDDYLRDTSDPEFLSRIKNVYKAKMFMGDELPPKVSLWGDKVTGNPEGRSKYAYYLFDPSKFKDISTDDFRFKLYNAFKTDYSADWLPSMPQRSITVNGEKIQLTPKEYAELSINVGKERAAMVSAYINSNDQITKEELKMRYDEGYELGKRKFMISHGMNVQYKFRKPLQLRSLTRKLNKSKPKF